jgi:hypothetical protein
VPLLVDIEVRATQFGSGTQLQSNGPWGPARLSSRIAFPNGDPTVNSFNYTFDGSSGRGTEVIIVDSGCKVDFRDIANRTTFLDTFGPGVKGSDITGRECLCFVPRPYVPLCADSIPKQHRFCFTSQCSKTLTLLLSRWHPSRDRSRRYFHRRRKADDDHLHQSLG